MELNVFQEIPNDFLQWNILVKKLFTFSGSKFVIAAKLVHESVAHAYRVIVAILLAPHECRLEFSKFIGPKLFAGQYQTDNVLRQ